MRLFDEVEQTDLETLELTGEVDETELEAGDRPANIVPQTKLETRIVGFDEVQKTELRTVAPRSAPPLNADVSRKMSRVNVPRIEMPPR